MFSKVTPDHDNRILVVISLDPRSPVATMLHLDLAALGLDGNAPFRVRDLLHHNTYEWRGPHNFVSLDPHATFMHLFRIE